MRSTRRLVLMVLLALGRAVSAEGLITGPFCGVSLENLTDTPMLIRNIVLAAQGKQLLALGGGMKLEKREGRNVVVTQKGFFLEFEAELTSGRYGLAVFAGAPDKSSDSYWIQVDGKRLRHPLVPPVGAMGERSIPVNVSSAGKHRLRLVLREAPGSAISRLEFYNVANKIPSPPMRKELLGRHPRLFFTAGDLDAMRARIRNKRVRRFYVPGGALTRKPPAFKPGARNGGPFRSLGNSAFSYLMEPDEKKLESILLWLKMATTYPHCGVDLDAEYFMEGVARTYDWLYEVIPEPMRTRVRDTIARQCRQVYSASLHGRAGGSLSFQQNHYWFAHLSLALGAAAVCGEIPEAESWLAWAWDRLERIALSFSPDGAFHEGPSYWDYSMPTLYMYTDLYEWCTGLRVPAADKGLHGQAEFRFHHLYPGFQSSAALEDSPTRLRLPAERLLLWEAKRFSDPVVMGMADLLHRRPMGISWRLLWLNEKLQTRAPREILPLGKYYPDVETAFARTGWQDDATYVAFVSRPLGGHQWAGLCAKFGLGGTGHNHPAQNHFILFGRGEMLAGDPGYTYEKRTRNHNTVLVDGKGQFGDGQMWPSPQPGRAHITQFVNDGDITIVTGDASSAYPTDLDLARFDRTLVLADRDLVVVCDRLASREPRTFSWLLHHYGRIARSGNTWTITRNAAQLRVVPLLPGKFEAVTTVYRPQYVHPSRNLTPKKDADVNLLELKTGPTTEATFLVSLIVGDAGESMPDLRDVSTDTCIAVRVGSTLVAFNRGEATMTVELPWDEKLRTRARTLVARFRKGKRQFVVADRDSVIENPHRQ